MKPHKHAEAIKAWADGETIEMFTADGCWMEVSHPSWMSNMEYRIKKESKFYPIENDYERGFIDGMQRQMQSSVDKAVNAMSQRKEWVGLTDADLIELVAFTHMSIEDAKSVEAKLKEKNNG